jgi:hypothetical protein
MERLMGQRQVYGIARVYLIPNDEAVQIGRCEYMRTIAAMMDVHECDFRMASFLLADKGFQILYGYGFLKKALRIDTGTQYKGRYAEEGIHIAYAPAVVTVKDAPLECMLHTSSPPPVRFLLGNTPGNRRAFWIVYLFLTKSAIMRYEALNPSFSATCAVKNDTLRAFCCCDSLFQNERAERQK